VDVEYYIIAIVIIEKELNNLVWKIVKRHSTKKRPSVFRNAKKRCVEDINTPYLRTCPQVFMFASFELWMPKGSHDVFAFVINSLGGNR
jgi:hypothetical protein